MKIAYVITTFLRDDLLRFSLTSAITSLPAEIPILIGDQAYTKEKASQISAMSSSSGRDIVYLKQPFDCGLSQARNILVAEALKRFDSEFIWISADSLKLIELSSLPLKKAIELLRADDKAAGCGFNITGRVPWEFNMDFNKEEGFILAKPQEVIWSDYYRFTPCNICRNFFVAKAKILLKNKWDDELKLCEHEDFFWRLKQAGYYMLFTDAISADYMPSRSAAYAAYRERAYTEYRKKLLDKYNAKKWVTYK